MTRAGPGAGLTSARHFQMYAILGPPAQGETSLTDEIVTGYRARGGRAWIVDPSNNWPGDPGQIWSGLDGVDAEIERLKSAGPGLLVLDDADYYMRNPTRARLEILTSFRHMQKDVLIVARRPQGIPKDAIANADMLCLFAMREVYARRYIAEQVGDPKIAREIPSEPYRYLWLLQDGKGTRGIAQTRPRKTVAASDAKRFR